MVLANHQEIANRSVTGREQSDRSNTSAGWQQPKETKALAKAVRRFRADAEIYRSSDGHRWACLSEADVRADKKARKQVLGTLPGLYPEWLGSRAFTSRCGCRFAYVAGEMARGIATADMVVEAVRAGFVGFFGSAGLKPDAVAKAIADIRDRVENDAAWGMNLIHSPDRPERETQMVDLFLAEKVRNVSASAFMTLSKEIVRYSAAGLTRGADGEIIRGTNIFAKISRPEVATAFLTPPPAAMLAALVAEKAITAEQADWQAELPTAEFLTVEADSGGHTDSRPLASLFPTICEVRDRLARKYDYRNPIFLGAAGGIGTPSAAAAAFALGADYIVTGSINQSAVEAGLSDDAKALLCVAGIADVGLAPAADMFEVGAKVQVLKRGTMFANTAHRLHELYRRYSSFDELPERERAWVETKVLRQPFSEVWQQTKAYHAGRNDGLVARAAKDGRIKMALVFKRFMFEGAKWARDGDTGRRTDYQIWCGPAMGAFNDWVKSSFLDDSMERTVRQIGLNILEGAASTARAQQFRSMGVAVPPSLLATRPQRLDID